MSNLVSDYDNEWTITVTNENLAATPHELQETKGCFLGNGKIGFVSAFHKIGVQKSFISGTFDVPENGNYTNNVYDSFDHTTISFFDNKQAWGTAENVQFVEQSLNMYNGICTSDFQITNAETEDVLKVSCDIYPVRNMPYSSIQTLRITPQQPMASLSLFHEVSAGNNIVVEDFFNNYIYSEVVNPDKGTYVLGGKGRFVANGKSIALSSCYISDNSNMTMIGFNRSARDLNKCYQKIMLKDLVAFTEYKIHILSTVMTEMDFKTPNEEVKRVAINVASKVTNETQVTLLRQKHVAAWASMWKSNITIDPKIGITPEEELEIKILKRVMRYSFYNLWSSVREGIKSEVNPLSLSAIDQNGSLYYDGDLWVVPLLTLLRPDIAKTMIESRYRALDRAVQLAAGYGYEGSKYPYVDPTGLTETPYWDVNGPVHLFNTALVSVSVWNYFRITQDRDWLINKGFTILKNNADFFASKCEYDESDGKYHLNGVYSYNQKLGDDNAMTNYLVRLAFKYALEACYETNYVPREKWLELYFNIDMTYFDDDATGVIKLDRDATPTDTYKFLETFVPLTAIYNENYFQTNIGRNLTTIQTNYDLYAGLVNPTHEKHPLNNIIVAWIQAQLCALDSNYTETFYQQILKIIEENVHGLWGDFRLPGGPAFNDIAVSSMFLLMILSSIGTVKFSGSISETRFYNSALGYKIDHCYSMPKTFKNVRITGLGPDSDSHVIINDQYY